MATVSSSLLLPKARKCVRSISLPARFHPSTYRIEEELNNLKSWEIDATSSRHLNAESIESGLSGLKNLYECVEDVLQLPFTQKHARKHTCDQDDKLVDEVLDGSVKLLDVCDTSRNILIQMKENSRELQYGLRRRGGDQSTAESSVDAYVSSKKKLKKDMVKCIGVLKRMESKFTSYIPLSLDHQNNHLVVVVRVLREVSSITILIFKSLLSFLTPSSVNPISKWALVSKLLQQKGTLMVSSNKEEQDDMIDNEVESVDVALHNLSVRKNNISTKNLEVLQKRLNVLEGKMESLENGLECMFKCLIKTRVSLLNNLSASHSRDLNIR
ncbi:uncharacterized protein LOC113286119 [Papaver somniferum]|uniref:uncharacterized protein LOC113286119 n=1 Tax=Papaver somniferum TaxID=3469 RepID=UPI000E6F85C5|nr:uncharacterized protein LOC113286119 [Papaver somniferum]